MFCQQQISRLNVNNPMEHACIFSSFIDKKLLEHQLNPQFSESSPQVEFGYTC